MQREESRGSSVNVKSLGGKQLKPAATTERLQRCRVRNEWKYRTKQQINVAKAERTVRRVSIDVDDKDKNGR